MIRVFVSGPITHGNPEHNFAQADDAMQSLIDSGFNVFNPMLCMRSAHANSIEWATWLKLDLDWLQECDAVLRLPGLSKGANVETALAGKLGIPVFNSVAGIIAHFKEMEIQSKVRNRLATE